MITRRAFIGTVTGGLLATPLAAEAQPGTKSYRVGYLSFGPGPSPRSEALRQGLRELGYVEGQNVTIEYRWAKGSIRCGPMPSSWPA